MFGTHYKQLFTTQQLLIIHPTYVLRLHYRDETSLLASCVINSSALPANP